MSARSAQAALLAHIWALGDSPAPPQGRALPAVPLSQGLAVYRENAKALSVRALGAAYPRVAGWLGAADFAGLAWAHARAHPPVRGDASAWGEALPAFLQGLPGMEPALPALAELDWALHGLATVADDPAPHAELWAVLQAVPPERLRLRLSPSLRLLRLPALADEAAWAAAQVGQAAAAPEPGPDLVLWRQGWSPQWAALPADAVLWCQHLLRGATLGAALDAVLEAHPGFDLAAWLAMAWQRRWLLGADELRAAV